jgi:predicted acyl esterase
VKGCDNGYDEQDRVRYWVDGTASYAGASRFPPPRARVTRLHLDGAGEAGGSFTAAAPTTGESRWAAIPKSAPLPDGLDDVMPQKLRYTTAFDRETTLAGPVTVSLSFSCNEMDSHVVAALSRLDASGERHLLTMGALRPAQRRIDAALSTPLEIVIEDAPPEPLVPGERVTLRFSLVPAAARFLPGEKLLLEIASRTDRVKGSVADAYVHFDLEVPPYFSRNVVHHGEDSYLEVHVET